MVLLVDPHQPQPPQPPLVAEVLICLGDTVLELRELRAGGPGAGWGPGLRRGGGVLLGVGGCLLGLTAVLGTAGLATVVGLVATAVGAGVFSVGVAVDEPRVGDRFVVGEAPGVDFPWALTADDRADEGAAPLVQVLDEGVILGLLGGLEGTITAASRSVEAATSAGAGAAGESRAPGESGQTGEKGAKAAAAAPVSASVSDLRAAGWRRYRLGAGDRAELRRGALRITVTVTTALASPLPSVESAPWRADLSLSSLCSLFSLSSLLSLFSLLSPFSRSRASELVPAAALALMFVVLATHERAPAVLRLETPPPERLLRAITRPPPLSAETPEDQAIAQKRKKNRQRRAVPASRPPRRVDPRDRPERPQELQKTPEEPAMVEVAGERVAAPSLSRSVDRSLAKRAPAAGRARRLADVAPGDPGAAILDDMAERWQEIDAVSLAHYVNSQADSDAWEALTAGPPVQRGFGGLELVGKGRPGGGEAAGVGSAGEKSQYAENNATPGAKKNTKNKTENKTKNKTENGLGEGSLRIGAPKGGGAGDRDHWAEVARGGRSALRRCWERGAAAAGGAALTLEVTIDHRGGVRDARISGAPAAAGELRRCLEEAAKGWRYAAPSGGGEATVRYPLRYEPA